MRTVYVPKGEPPYQGFEYTVLRESEVIRHLRKNDLPIGWAFVVEFSLPTRYVQTPAIACQVEVKQWNRTYRINGMVLYNPAISLVIPTENLTVDGREPLHIDEREQALYDFLRALLCTRLVYPDLQAAVRISYEPEGRPYHTAEPYAVLQWGDDSDFLCVEFGHEVDAENFRRFTTATIQRLGNIAEIFYP